MPRITGCNDRQSSFLRAFHDHPAGPPPQHWPSPAILRRWLRKPRFRAALQSIHSTLRLQESFLLTAASNTALRTLDPISSSPNLIRNTLTLLRLSHLRHRFEATTTPPPPAPAKLPQPKLKAEPEKPKYIPPEDRLTDEEFKKLAWQRNYHGPLRQWPNFPPPTAQDTFYYQLLTDPDALLWWLKQYHDQTPDKRHSPILANCQRLIPTDRPDHPLPRFSPTNAA